MKTNRSLALLWGVAALAGAWILFGFVDFLAKKKEYLTPLDPGEVRTALREKAGRSELRAARRDFAAYQNLHKLNVTGKAETAPATDIGPPLAPTPPVTPVADLVRVACVFFDEQDATGRRAYDPENFNGQRCFVEYKDPTLAKEAEPSLTVGDHLIQPHQDVEVKEIFEDRVVFSRPGAEDEAVPVQKTEIGEEVLSAVRSEGEEGPASRAAPRTVSRAPSPPGWPEVTTEVQTTRWKVSQRDADEIGGRATELAGTEIALVPAYRKGEGRPYGIRVPSIKPGSILEGKGIEAGDVVKAINGTTVSSKEQVFEYARSHPELRSFTLEIERKGRPLTLSYSLPR